MTDNVENLITKAANLGTDPKFEKWNNLPPGVQAEYAEAMRANNSSSTDNIVKLDIGGIVFKTSKSTLTKFDGFFKTMLETDVPITKDKSDCIFIDRSAKHFDKILNFMRDGNVDLPDSIELLKEIQKEAQYYLLDGLVELCSEEVVKKNGKNNTISQNTEDGIRVIETDTEFVRIMNRDSAKPSLIIYFLIGATGRTIAPEGFDIPTFLNKYKHKLDIYFRAYNVPEMIATADRTEWRWSLHYRGGYSYQAPKQNYQYNSNEIPESFEVQLPVLIIYYHVGTLGRILRLKGFIIRPFLDKYQHKLNIYFKSYSLNQTSTTDPTEWRWSLHYRDGYSFAGATSQKLAKGGSVNVEPFGTQLENAIFDFFKTNSLQF